MDWRAWTLLALVALSISAAWLGREGLTNIWRMWQLEGLSLWQKLYGGGALSSIQTDHGSCRPGLKTKGRASDDLRLRKQGASYDSKGPDVDVKVVLTPVPQAAGSSSASSDDEEVCAALAALAVAKRTLAAANTAATADAAVVTVAVAAAATAAAAAAASAAVAAAAAEEASSTPTPSATAETAVEESDDSSDEDGPTCRLYFRPPPPPPLPAQGGCCGGSSSGCLDEQGRCVICLSGFNLPPRVGRGLVFHPYYGIVPREVWDARTEQRRIWEAGGRVDRAAGAAARAAVLAAGGGGGGGGDGSGSGGDGGGVGGSGGGRAME